MLFVIFRIQCFSVIQNPAYRKIADVCDIVLPNRSSKQIQAHAVQSLLVGLFHDVAVCDAATARIAIVLQHPLCE